MHTDEVVEDLTEGKEQGCAAEIDQWSPFAKDFDDQVGLHEKEGSQEDQRNQLIQDIQSHISILTIAVIFETGIEMSRPTVAGVEGDVASADEEKSGRSKDQSD